MSDVLLRAIARDTGIQITVALTTGMVERARQIHNCTPLAIAALGRALTGASMLGNQLKAEQGSVTLQVKGNGPLGTIVCVSDIEGNVRGYVQNPDCDLPLRESDGKIDVGGGVGQGILVVIKDVGMKDPVSGTVALQNGEIAADLTRYFAESEQIPSACALGVLVDVDYSVKCAGGYLVQLMPGVTEEQITKLEQNLAGLKPITQMLDEGMSAEEIAKAVLEGFEVEVLETAPVEYRCYCSRERVVRALISMGRQELTEMAEEQEISEVCCHFCDKKYTITRDELLSILEKAKK